jgi:ATP-dependent Lon protease
MKNTIQFSKMTKKNKNLILDRVHQMEVTEPASSEFYKMKQYMEGIYKIPFGIYKNLSITNKSSKIEITNFLENIQKQLDKSIYGHNKAKIDILNVVSQWINNPESSCPIIGIQGAPGIGKTCLIKEGISKALNIPFASLPLGGISDGSHLVGHSYTYIGSKWGRIIEILMTTKCMNPIIYFDELDKISTSEKGEEINGILTHLTDQTQNNEFHDKYYEGIDFDLSKAFFIFSFNNEHQINPILRDRIKIIHLDGFNKKDKIKISRDYILKDILKNIGMVKEDVVITDEIWNYFVETYDGKEKGVRTLKKNLEHILMNLNTIKLLSLEKETNEITKDNSLYKMYKDLKDIKFPFTLTKEIIQKLLKEKNVDKAPLSLYI